EALVQHLVVDGDTEVAGRDDGLHGANGGRAFVLAGTAGRVPPAARIRLVLADDLDPGGYRVAQLLGVDVRLDAAQKRAAIRFRKGQGREALAVNPGVALLDEHAVLLIGQEE